MPKWTLATVNGTKEAWDVTDYKKTKAGVVLSFAIRFNYQGKMQTETFMLAPKHRHKEVSEVVKNALGLLSSGGGAAAGYRLGSAGGMVGGLTGAALGFVLGHLAGHVAEEFYENDIYGGDYYDSGGAIAFRGLITVS